MAGIRFMGAVLLCGAAGHAADAAWTDMFNGTDLSGWEGDPAHWVVKDSAITVKGATSVNTFLIWKTPETDFVLQADIQVPGQGEANSGIQFRSRAAPAGPRWKVCGPQADIGPEKYGALYQECLGRIIPPDASRCRSAGSSDGWNRYELRVDGNRWSLKMNGVACFEHTEPSGSPHAGPGMVALQYHAPGYPVRFKALRLQRLNIPTSLRARRPPAEPLPGRTLRPWLPFLVSGRIQARP